jgi:hypothetical protein
LAEDVAPPVVVEAGTFWAQAAKIERENTTRATDFAIILHPP